MTQSKPFPRLGFLRHAIVIAFLLFGSASAQAARTLMFMIDFWQRDMLDTIIDLDLFQPANEVKYLVGNPPPATPPKPVLSNAWEDESLGWWYSLPNFSADDYAMGRIRINTSYLRGWYQWDQDKFVGAGDTVFLPDTMRTFSYQNMRTGQNATVTLPGTKPNFFVFPDTARYKAPKLYTTRVGSQTDLLNQRGTTGVGNIDRCLDTIPNDTVWIRFGAIHSNPGQQATNAMLRCTGYNPYTKSAAKVFLRNPWPGADLPVVEFNGTNVPLYPYGANPDWLVADLRYFAHLGTPSPQIRFKKSANSNIYFDSAGLDQATAKPFVLTSLTGGNFYFVPPEAGADVIAKPGPPPQPAYYLYVQNPWKPGSPRLLWESDKNYHVMRPTQSCGWFRYPMYAAPKRVLIGHSFEDSTYGATGIQFRARENWIDIPASAISAGKVYIETRDAQGNRIPARTTSNPSLKDCSTDTLKLVMEAFDFKANGQTGGNPAFQVGGVADATGTASSGLAKGMVQTYLDADGQPVWTGRDSGYQAGGIKAAPNNGRSNPGNWFDTTELRAAVPGIMIGHSCLELPLAKGPSDSGYYKYNNRYFFPLDTITDQRGMSRMAANDLQQHNFLYCLHGHAAFEYTPGLKFEFRGDDDVWVFINNKLAVDLGGTHAPESAYVDLNKLKLREGSVYPFDIFYCERQTNGSSILIRTTMDLQPSWKYRASPKVTTSGTDTTYNVVIEGQKSSNYVPSCADLTSGKVLPWTQTEGRMVLVGPDGSDLSEIYTTDVSLYGGNLTYQGGAVKVNTKALSKSPDLKWAGTYTVRIESRLGDSLYQIQFTKVNDWTTVQGLVIDGNGDGIADSIRLSARTPVFKDNPAYHLVWFKASGARDSVQPAAASVRRISDSVVVAPLAGINWGVRTEIPAGTRLDSLGAVLTTPGGVTPAVVNPIKLADGIAPIADSARLSFGTGGGDTLRIWVNETALANQRATAADVWAKVGRSATPRDVTVLESAIDGKEIRLVLGPGHGITPADSARVAGKVSDALWNGAANSSVWVPIRSNALGTAALYDADGDGRADSVSVSMRGAFAGVAKVQVGWKDATGTSVVKTWPVAGSPTGSFGVRADANGAFPKGATSCPGGGCLVTFLDASGKTLEVWSIIDSVAPIALRGRYVFGDATDTLRVRFSEPLVSLSVLPAWLQWGRAGVLAGPVQHATMNLAGAAKDSAVFVLDTANGIRAGHDSIRIAVSTTNLTDGSGSRVGPASPWAPLALGLPPMVVVLRDPAGTGSGTHIEVSPVRALPVEALGGIASLQVRWKSAAGNADTRDVVFATLAVSGANRNGPLPTAFDFGVTSCPAGACEVVATSASGDARTWTLLDGVQPTLVRATYRFSGMGANRDTVILRASEPWVGANTAAPTPFALVGASTRPLALSMVSWSISTDGLEATAIIDSVMGSAILGGDSARFVGGAGALVVDARDNRPFDVSPWRPIEFGMRPATLDIALYPPGGMLSNSANSTQGSWPLPPAGTPPTEVLVMDSETGRLEANPDLSKLRTPDGQMPRNDLGRVLAVRLVLNRPLEGNLFIFDHMGTHAATVDLTPMSKAWLSDSANLDKMREVWMLWNGTDDNGKFVASGVYIFRAVVRVENDADTYDYRNMVWNLGWRRDN